MSTLKNFIKIFFSFQNQIAEAHLLFMRIMSGAQTSSPSSSSSPAAPHRQLSSNNSAKNNNGIHINNSGFNKCKKRSRNRPGKRARDHLKAAKELLEAEKAKNQTPAKSTDSQHAPKSITQNIQTMKPPKPTRTPINSTSTPTKQLKDLTLNQSRSSTPMLSDLEIEEYIDDNMGDN